MLRFLISSCIFVSYCHGQIVSTFVGGGSVLPASMAIDSEGNVYLAEGFGHRIRKITKDGVVSTFAGSGSAASIDGQGVAASLNVPPALAQDPKGDFYVTEYVGCKIRKISPTGYVSTFAGNGICASTDGGRLQAQFNAPWGIAIDPSGIIFVSDFGGLKIRIIFPNGSVSTLAGTGMSGYANGPGSAATFTAPRGICLDNDGNVIVADGAQIRKVNRTGWVSTIAGNYNGFQDGYGTAALLNTAVFPALDYHGNLFFTDHANKKIRRINSTSYVGTYAGSTSGSTDGALSAAKFVGPHGLAFDTFGSLYVADNDDSKVRKIACPLPSACSSGLMASVSFNCQCVPCPIGTFQSDGNQTYCRKCPQNSTCAFSGMKTFTCDAGFGQSNGSCVACQSGSTYNRGTGGSCLSCPANSTCTTSDFKCLPGLTELTNQCVPCSPGRFKNFTGNAQCDLCPVGEFQPQSGQTKCITCPQNALCVGGSVIFDCNQGYSKIDFEPFCTPLPSNVPSTLSITSVSSSNTGLLTSSPPSTSIFSVSSRSYSSISSMSVFKAASYSSKTLLTSPSSIPAPRASNFWLDLWRNQPIVGVFICVSTMLLLLVIGFLLGYLRTKTVHKCADETRSLTSSEFSAQRRSSRTQGSTMRTLKPLKVGHRPNLH